MHTMQEDDSVGGGGGGGGSSDLEDGFMNGSSEHRIDSFSGARGQPLKKNRKSLKLVMAAVGGMLLPLITQIGHAH